MRFFWKIFLILPLKEETYMIINLCMPVFPDNIRRWVREDNAGGTGRSHHEMNKLLL